jgi:hypothetical protein
MPQYEVLELIGRGGMGAVYRARQKSLKRLVAIKVLPVDAADDELKFAERFKNEAFAMARLSHTGIVNVHDAGETAGGLLYFVMEHVEGQDLAHEIADRAPLPQAEVRLIAMQVCEALGYLHGNGVIHRDIKPANILLDAQGKAKVADFGLARLDEPLASGLLTRTGTSLGTADFMAPECRRAAASVDHRADLFSLGVAIYQMLTGELPHGMFKLPSQLLPEIDERFDAIICKALEPKPEDRYQSANEMRDDLEVISGTAKTDVVETQNKTAGLPPPRRSVARLAMAFGAAVALGASLLLVMRKTEPAAAGGGRVTSTPESATKDAPFVNSLGMKFLPVPITGGTTGKQRVLFSVWETRVQDYEEFVKDAKREWRGPTQPPHPSFRWPQVVGTEPAVYVSWLDAKAFAEWLTQKDRAVRLIGEDLAYRLPMDHEWSCAVGLGEKEDPAMPPRQKGDLLPNVFAWGTAWPPPRGAGNLADQKARAEGVYSHLPLGQEFIDGYDDGHAFIAPVGSFQPNRLGLHDLAGNVEEYVEDRSTTAKNERVLRGAHWGAASPNFIKASFRNACPETGTNHLVGFRVVLAPAMPPTKAAAVSAIDSSEALFDGLTFSGWKTNNGAAPESSWRVEADALTSSTRTTMRTVAEFGDCELYFEWRVGAGGNGGVFYHVLGDPLAAPELQVCDPANAGRTPSGGLFGVVQPLSDASKPLGEWNTGRLVVRGSLREHWINGQKVCAYDAASADFRAKLAASTFAGKPQFGVGSRGALALQNNGGEVAYRNLRIQRLNEKPVSESMHEAPTLQWQRVDLSAIKGLKPDGGRYRCTSYVLLEDVIGHPVKNIAVKVTAAPAPGNFPLHIMLRTAPGGKRYQGVIQTKTIHGGIGYWEASRAIPEELQGSTASPVPVDGQTSHEFEFRAIEENLTLRQDGIVVATATDARLKEGGIAVQIGEGGVLSSIEYAILDGLSDGTQPGMINEKPAAKTAPEVAWTDWLGPRLAMGEFKSDGYARDGDGVTTNLLMKGTNIIPDGVKDGAARVTGLLRGAGIQITARDRKTGSARELYVAEDTGDSFYIGRMMPDHTVVNLVEKKYPTGITRDGEHTLEFRCVGSTLTATLNGTFTITTEDSTLTQGPWAVVLKRGAVMNKVEVQVLSRE